MRASRHLQKWIAILALFLISSLTTACGTFEVGIERTASPDPVATITPSDLATSEPTLSSTSTPLPDPSTYLSIEHEGGVLGDVWQLADVRYGIHPDRVQIVWEMVDPGDHVPAFRVVEVDNAASPFPTGHDPSWGEARIDLVVSDLYARNSPIIEQLPFTLPDDPLVTRIGLYPTFSDSHLGFSIGLREPAAYEVYELTDPIRIVIAVLYPTAVANAPTPTPFLDHWVAYSNSAFAISLEYPVNWQPVLGYSGAETGETKFAGDNGFFAIGAMDVSTIDDAVAIEAEHIQQPYGSQPIIESLQIQGQEARLILPSADQSEGMDDQAALIVRYPQPVNVLGVLYHYFVLWADYPHIRTIAQTLQFGANSASITTPTLAPPLTWENLPPGLVYSTSDGLWLVNSDEQPVQVHNNSQAIVSPDGAQIISYDNLQQDAWLINRTDGAIWNLTQTPNRVELCLSWWPGRPDVVLFQSSGSDVNLGPGMEYYLTAVNIDGQRYQILDAEHDTNTLSGPGQFAPSPDGQTIAYSSGGTGWLYRWGAGPEIFDPASYGLTGYGEVQIAQPAWSPDGARLAWIVKGNFAVDGNLRAGVALFNLDTRTAQVLHPYEPQGAGWPSAPVWSLDGQWLAFGDGSSSANTGLWVAKADDPPEEYHLGLGGNPIWSPDGRWLAFQGVQQDGVPAYLLAEVGTWGLRPLSAPLDRYGQLVDWINP
jgi:hypothetical protein